MLKPRLNPRTTRRILDLNSRMTVRTTPRMTRRILRADVITFTQKISKH